MGIEAVGIDLNESMIGIQLDRCMHECGILHLDGIVSELASRVMAGT